MARRDGETEGEDVEVARNVGNDEEAEAEGEDEGAEDKVVPAATGFGMIKKCFDFHKNE